MFVDMNICQVQSVNRTRCEQVKCTTKVINVESLTQS